MSGGAVGLLTTFLIGIPEKEQNTREVVSHE